MGLFKKGLIFCIIISFTVSTSTLVYGQSFRNEKHNNLYMIQTVKKVNPRDLSEASLGKLKLHDSEKQVYKILGKPKRKDYGIAEYKGITFMFNASKKIYFFSTTFSKYPTKRGVRVGDSYEKISKSYGKPAYTEKVDGATVYHYDFTNDNIMAGFTIFFSVKKGKISEMGFMDYEKSAGI